MALGLTLSQAVSGLLGRFGPLNWIIKQNCRTLLGIKGIKILKKLAILFQSLRTKVQLHLNVQAAE